MNQMMAVRLLGLFMVVIRAVPEQVHLAYGDAIDSMVVSWSTPGAQKGSSNDSTVKYGLSGQPAIVAKACATICELAVC